MKKLRQEFADTMLEVGVDVPDLVVLVGDISHGILQPFAKACPGRFYNIGICEPTIVNLAAGLSKVGLIPVVHTIAPFLVERSYEQIKLDFGYQGLAVNLVSVGAAFDYGQLGCSHHCYTDISLIAHLPRSRVICPGSPAEFNVLFKEVYRDDAINYFRLPEIPHGIEFNELEISLGRAIIVREGTDVSIVCFGSQLRSAIGAAEQLAARGVDAEIVYLHTLKPLDIKAVRQSIAKTGRAVIVEEASASDGLFNMVLRETCSLDGISYEHIAIHDFIRGYGTYDELAGQNGFSADGIVARVSRWFPLAGVAEVE